MSTIRVVNVQHTDATEPNIVLESDGTTVFASGITISGGTNLTVSGTAEFASGTASAPGVTFIDDNNTGIFEPAVDTVAITTSGSEKARINNEGTLFLGLTTTRNISNASGKLNLNGDDYGNSAITLSRDTTDAFGPTLAFGKSKGTLATPLPPISGDELGKLVFAGYDTGDFDNSSARINAVAEATFTTDTCPTAITFATTTTNSLSEKLRITSAGRVGIGESTAIDSLLHVKESSSSGKTTVLTLEAPGTAANDGPAIDFIPNGSSIVSASIVGARQDAGGGDGCLQFYTNNATTNLERARFDSSGRLLIGTSVNGYNNARVQIAGTNSNNYLSILNTTASDADNNGWSIIAFRRTQSGGEESTSAVITGRHDGTGDDQKGKLELSTNDGNDNNGAQPRIKIYSNGYVRLTTNSPGIQFNDDSAAANALNDYEEGTWTPDVRFGGANTGITYGGNNGGSYTKIGRLVLLHVRVELTSKGTATGAMTIQGLPYAAGDNQSGSSQVEASAALAGFQENSFITTLGNVSLAGRIAQSATELTLHYFNFASGDQSNVTNTNMSNDSTFSLDIVYQT
jgi:hypothetical protein